MARALDDAQRRAVRCRPQWRLPVRTRLPPTPINTQRYPCVCARKKIQVKSQSNGSHVENDSRNRDDLSRRVLRTGAPAINDHGNHHSADHSAAAVGRHSTPVRHGTQGGRKRRALCARKVPQPTSRRPSMLLDALHSSCALLPTRTGVEVRSSAFIWSKCTRKSAAWAGSQAIVGLKGR